MKKLICLFVLFAFLPLALRAQLVVQEEAVTLKTATGDIFGTLRVPNISKPMPVVIIIAGSGPTDRDGNQPVMKNNSLKMLAEGLFKSNIATLCYDKRGIAASSKAMKAEADIRFEHYIGDVQEWINLLSADKRFSQVIIAGHSEGALIGMRAAVKNSKVAKYISLAGLGMPAADLLKIQLEKQLSGQPDSVRQQVFGYIDKLQKGETFSNVPAYLNALFRPSVQPYLISFFRYNPQKEIAQLTIPVLIVQGNTDIQVSVTDADLLAKANPKATKSILPNVNHVLKVCNTTDQQTQMTTYNNPSLPISPEVLKVVTAFVISK